MHPRQPLWSHLLCRTRYGMGRFGSFVAPHTVAFFDRQRGTAPKRVKRRHAGGIGFADFCESNLGERVLLNELCKDVATEIAVYVPNGFSE
mmetsp:Transcript_17544/g.33321  ORF Transcript_17544/g.33321 Transcript_17544/m.33321 type:complete len:91 (-) Transcript_17544:53-325(-)